jgi:NTP pyrophosphatase (non-canonical NTP hydrolase)
MSDELLGELALQCVVDSHNWFPDQGDLMTSIPYHTLAYVGEAGELANIVKKIQRGSLDWNDGQTQFKFAMELVDGFIYMLNLSGLTSINLKEAYEVKRKINMERFSRCVTCSVQAENHEEADHPFEWPDYAREVLDAIDDKEVPGSFDPVRQEEQ